MAALLRAWDKGSKSTRLDMLGRIILNYESMTGPQLEAELENTASLLLARISSWLRLTYPLGHSVALQLRAIGVFVAASSGQRFLAEFVEVGGVTTVIAVLNGSAEADRHEAVRLLSAVAEAGRHYKEVICEAEGHAQIERLMGDSRDEQLLEDARDLLVALGRGNPTHASAVHRCVLSLLGSANTVTQRLACAGLRTLLAVAAAQKEQPQIVDASYAEAAVALLNSFNLQVLYEASQLYQAIVAIDELEGPLLAQLLAKVRSVPLRADEREGGAGAPPHAAAAAARSLGQLVSAVGAERRAALCARLQLVPWLCRLLLCDNSPECQKSAVQALQLLGWCGGAALDDMRHHLGKELLQALMDAADAPEAVSGIAGAMIDPLRTHIEAFVKEQALS